MQLTEEQRKKLKTDLRDGMKVPEAAVKHGVPYHQAYQYRKAMRKMVVKQSAAPSIKRELELIDNISRDLFELRVKLLNG